MSDKNDIVAELAKRDHDMAQYVLLHHLRGLYAGMANKAPDDSWAVKELDVELLALIQNERTKRYEAEEGLEQECEEHEETKFKLEEAKLVERSYEILIELGIPYPLDLSVGEIVEIRKKLEGDPAWLVAQRQRELFKNPKL